MNFRHADNEGSDQTAQIPRLIFRRAHVSSRYGSCLCRRRTKFRNMYFCFIWIAIITSLLYLVLFGD